jgi:hypothetical protein
LHVFFGFAPRRLGKADLGLDATALAQAEAARPGWTPHDWSLDGAARVLALLVHASPRAFAERFSDLRRTADAGEMITLYRGLPLYPEPETLDFEVGEGLRSNLRPVFEAIAHDNPWPAERFDDHRWNHMVLKALFIGAALGPIRGLDERATPGLARILIDTARERHAARRPINDALWRVVRPFAGLAEIAGLLAQAQADGLPLPPDIAEAAGLGPTAETAP